jgi:hypothetical protein
LFVQRYKIGIQTGNLLAGLVASAPGEQLNSAEPYAFFAWQPTTRCWQGF